MGEDWEGDLGSNFPLGVFALCSSVIYIAVSGNGGIFILYDCILDAK